MNMANLPDTSDIATRVVVGTAGTVYTFFGMPLSDVAAVCTAVYMIFSAVLLIPKLIAAVNEFRQKRKNKDADVG